MVVKELVRNYINTSIYKAIIVPSKASIFFWCSAFFILASYVGLFLSFKDIDFIFFCYTFCTLVLSSIFHFFSVRKCLKYIKYQSKRGNNGKFDGYFIRNSDLKIWKGYRYKELINRYKIEQMMQYIGPIYNSKEKIEDLITIINDDKSHRHQMNWMPMAILAIILLPVISEYVGFRFNVLLEVKAAELSFLIDGINSNEIIKKISLEWAKTTNVHGLALLKTLSIFLIFLGIGIWRFTLLSRLLLLNKVDNRQKVVDLLRLIKIYKF